MWVFFLIVYIVLSVGFTQCYKVAIRGVTRDGCLMVLVITCSGLFAFLFIPFFPVTFPSDWKVYGLMALASVFYAVSDRLNTTIRGGLEASTVSMITQLSTVFMIVAGLLFFREPFVWKKMIGAALIILSNIFIFYKKNGKHENRKFVWLGVLANLSLSVALFLDVNISEHFNLAFYVGIMLIIPAMYVFLLERIRLSDLKAELRNGNVPFILLTSFCGGIKTLAQLRAYQLGEVTTVAPLCALIVIGDVLAGYLFLHERNDLAKKLVAATVIVFSVFLIKGGS